MFKRLFAAAAFGTLALATTAVEAAPLTVDFCGVNAAECLGDGLAEARLTFDEIAGGDINDYTATLFFRGNPSGAHTFIDQVQFKIDGASYEGLPVLNSAPNAGWTPYFGSVPNCGSGGDLNSVCADHSSVGATLGNNGALTWVFTLDLADGFGLLSSSNSVNMRASFEQGQFSPGGGRLTTTGGTAGTSGVGNVPEPAILGLLGTGLVAAARRRKARQ